MNYSLFALMFLGLDGASMLSPTQVESPALQATEREWIGVMNLTRPELHDLASWTASEKLIADEHFAYLKKLVDARVVILLGRTQDLDEKGHLAADEMGIMIFRAADRVGAEKIISDSPGVKGAMWRIKLHEYQIGAHNCP